MENHIKILEYRKSSNYLTLMKAIHISTGKAAPGQIGTKFHMEPLGARRMNVCSNGPGPEVIKLFSCSTQLSMKF